MVVSGITAVTRGCRDDIDTCRQNAGVTNLQGVCLCSDKENMYKNKWIWNNSDPFFMKEEKLL